MLRMSLRVNLRPSVTVHAFSEDEAVATRDAGWVELWSTDGDRRYGRGHLMLWPAEPASDASTLASGTAVHEDSAQPVDDSGPSLHAELRGFTFDGEPPAVGDSLTVRPEKEQDSYSVCVIEVEHAEPNGRIALDWPDDRLPAALAELGGY
jgi:hypothetical protein